MVVLHLQCPLQQSLLFCKRIRSAGNWFARRFVRQPEAGKRHAGQADAKFL